MRPLIIAVSGVKNSGKTTLLEALVRELTGKGYQVAVVKHDGHDFMPDVPGTDSYRFKQAGAYGTGVYSSSRFCIVKEQSQTEPEWMAGWFPEADVIFLEGQKSSMYPKIEVIRKEVSKKPVCIPETVFAYVTDVAELDGNGIPVLGFHEKAALIDIIDRRIKGTKS